jgi:hypothetical protein
VTTKIGDVLALAFKPEIFTTKDTKSTKGRGRIELVSGKEGDRW